MTNRIGVFSAKNDIELSWLIRPSVVYDENKTRQQQNQSTGAVYVENDIELLWLVRSGVDYEEK